MNMMELIKTRKSVRTFNGRPINPEDREKLCAYMKALADESILNDENKILLSKLQPIIYDEEGRAYLELGKKVSDAFKPGVELKKSLNI